MDIKNQHDLIKFNLGLQMMRVIQDNTKSINQCIRDFKDEVVFSFEDEDGNVFFPKGEIKIHIDTPERIKNGLKNTFNSAKDNGWDFEKLEGDVKCEYEVVERKEN